jgi:DNA-binding MarR family transcriptional regulator
LKQFSVLEWLLTKEYGHPAQLAEYIYADRPTATVVINNLQKAGCIEKTPDPDNKKYTRVAITEKGRQKAAQIRELINSRRRVTVTECLTDSEKTRLRALLGKIQAHLDKNTG